MFVLRGLPYVSNRWFQQLAQAGIVPAGVDGPARAELIHRRTLCIRPTGGINSEIKKKPIGRGRRRGGRVCHIGHPSRIGNSPARAGWLTSWRFVHRSESA